MGIVANSFELMANFVSKIPVFGRLITSDHLGVLQNPERNPGILALSKPVNKSTSFIYG